MISPSSIHPDVELRDRFLQENITVVTGQDTTAEVAVYGDWEKPTNEVPDDFIVIMLNGDIGGVGMDTPYADGYIIVSLYCRLNDDGSVKKNRVERILAQLDGPFKNPSTHDYQPLVTDNYCYRYEAQRFITPTTPNITSGYSITNLNLRWTTNKSFPKPKNS